MRLDQHLIDQAHHSARQENEQQEQHESCKEVLVLRGSAQKFRQERHHCAADSSACEIAHPAENPHRHIEYRVDEHEGVGIHELTKAREQAAGQAGIESADREGHRLVTRQVHSHSLRRELAIADGDEGAPVRGTDEVSREPVDADQDQRDEDMEILREKRISEQARRRHHDAVRPIREIVPVLRDQEDYQPKPEGHHRDIDRTQLQSREGKQISEGRGEKRARHERHPVSNAPFGHQKRRRVGADGGEAGMAERYLTGVAHDDVHAENGDRVDES